MKSEWLDKLALMLMEDEGYRERPYDDATGKEVKAPIGQLTIGVGWNLQANPLPHEAITLLLDISIRKALRDALDIFPELLDYGHARSHGIVNLIFNLGPHGLLKFHKFCEAVRAQDWRRAAKELERSRWYHQVGNRALRVISLIENEEYTYETLSN